MTPERKKILDQIAYGIERTWDTCAHDLLMANCEENNGHNEPMGTMSRAEVEEVTYDLFYGGHFSFHTALTPAEAHTNLTDEERKYVFLEALGPYEVFGY